MQGAHAPSTPCTPHGSSLHEASMPDASRSSVSPGAPSCLLLGPLHCFWNLPFCPAVGTSHCPCCPLELAQNIFPFLSPQGMLSIEGDTSKGLQWMAFGFLPA